MRNKRIYWTTSNTDKVCLQKPGLSNIYCFFNRLFYICHCRVHQWADGGWWWLSLAFSGGNSSVDWGWVGLRGYQFFSWGKFLTSAGGVVERLVCSAISPGSKMCLVNRKTAYCLSHVVEDCSLGPVQSPNIWVLPFSNCCRKTIRAFFSNVFQ